MANGLYLKIGSGDQVHGESRDPQHVGWIELLSFSLGQGSPATSDSAPKRNGPLCHIEKVTDRTTTYLLNAARVAHPLDLVTIDLADPQTGLPKYGVELQDVLITDFDTQRAKRDAPAIERFTCDFNSVKINSNPVPDDAVEQMLMLLARMLVR